MNGVGRLGALLAALVIAVSGCGSGRHTAQREQQPAVTGLRSIDQLREAFNAHPTVPRLILLVSPT